MKDTIKSIVTVVVFILLAFVLYLKFTDERKYDQMVSHIPSAARAISSNNYSEALAELRKIDKSDEAVLAAMAYCIYKTDGKSAAVRMIKDFLDKNNVNDSDRQFLLKFIDNISSDNISTFNLNYTMRKESRGERIEYGVNYY